jgi:hypothetical protein|tara:strand:+ start:2804 stop:3223 length:420 start_codon:yes stop_codon:yes gene_type:complete
MMKNIFGKVIAGAIILVVATFLIFFVVKEVSAHDNMSQKYYDNREFDGNYPSSQIRQLWQVCSINFQQKQPSLPQPLRWKVCDCYVDVIRRLLSSSEATKSTPAQAKELTATLINQCNGMLDNPPVMTNLEIPHLLGND